VARVLAVPHSYATRRSAGARRPSARRSGPRRRRRARGRRRPARPRSRPALRGPEELARVEVRGVAALALR
jgi:hypothetical protein